MLRYEPRDEDDDAEFGGKDRSRHSLFVTKARRAVDNGAVAILVVDQRNKKDELYRFNSRQALRSYGLPMASSVTMADYRDWGEYEEYLPLNIEGMYRHIDSFYRRAG